MYAEERQQEILDRARAAGRVDVAALAADFGVAGETIRRDLTTLERDGVLRRVHGGAIPVERFGFEPTLGLRNTVMTEEKDRIAKAALEEVPAEGAILIDAGSTTGRLAEHLPTDRELTVITNSLPIASTLRSRPAVEVLFVGGRVRARTMAAVGAWSYQILEQIYVDVAFIAANGISPERGLTTPDTSEAEVKRRMVRAARRAVLLCDHTKFGNDHLARFAQVEDIDTVITDTGLADGLADEVRSLGPRVELV
ncbi:DeoR/GlpR transcriptional regulator [Spiractinospora alimapuensis]|uniref:DeoR/GlpR family DNA-binding transcription regulator n=1 Tax=Spiractinospora alimapuensis TaxID=2820884 RepID=UPI001F1D3B9B|nr:DeoR/GlpR family DNA-binding transcription regulator [Spiractinospora alimapuensis]QVQ50024.1 DeoR/GlpR transcriptional regulator [Spiractinospora alimapuensis]